MAARNDSGNAASAALPVVAERVLLRDFTEADSVDVHQYAADPRVTANLCWGPNSAEQTRAFIAQARLEANREPRAAFNLGIEEIAAGQVIGGIHLRPRGESPGTFELGYCLRADRWGNGLASEAVAAMTAFGFERIQARRIVAEVFVTNPASARILEKLDFCPGEPFERHVTCRDERHQARLFTLDREIWRKGRP